MERDEAEVHLDACATCRKTVSALAKAGATQASRPMTPAATSVGRYIVIGKLGSGAMGDVYEAHDPELDRKIALKVLRTESARDAGARARLLREARALARLKDPHVVTVHDVGVVEERVFIAMELVGGTLRDWLEPRGPGASRGTGGREGPGERGPGASPGTGDRPGAGPGTIERPGFRSREEIIAAFIQAGRGLIAAHEAGLVHRDFKPDNVLRRDDGRFVVSDFGVARLATDAEERGPTTNDSLALQLTRDGAIVGTPLYMAPEQLRGEPPDARSDQYAFCISLLEALERAPPFFAHSIDELLALKERGIVLRNRALPSQLRRALARGLDPDPARRYPTMSALLAAISPRPRRVAWIAAAMIAVVVAVVGVMAMRPAPCQGADRHMIGIWDDDTRGRVRTALGDRAFPRVDELLSNLKSRWTDAYTDACVSTEVHREQSPELRDARFACLHRQRKLIAGVVDELAHADASVVSRAAVMAAGLPNPALCGDIERVRDEPTLPTEGERRRQAEAIEDRLAAAYAAWLAGRTKEADAIIKPAVVDAEKLAHQPLIADARYIAAIITFRLGEPAAALEHLDESLRAAARGRADRAAAKAMAWSLVPLVELRRSAEARRVQTVAEAALLRIGGDDEIEARMADTLVRLAVHEGNPRQAMQDAKRSYAMWRRARGEDHYETANARSSVGMIAYELGDYRAAEDALYAALAMQTRWYGADHPNTSVTRVNLAVVLAKRGAVDEARAEAQSVLESRVKAFGERSERVATTKLLLGEIELNAGNLEVAERHLTSAHDTYLAVLDPKHQRISDALFQLAVLETKRGRVDAALEKLHAARAITTVELQIARIDTATGNALLMQKRVNDAEALFLSAIERKKTRLPADHPSFAEEEDGLGRIADLRGDAEKARKHFDRARRLRETAGAR